MSQTKRKQLSQGLDKLFSTPSLMHDEDATAYYELYELVEDLVEPMDAWDHMMVSDVVNHFWEQQRYRRCTGSIINSRRRRALLTILGDAIGLNPDDATDVADIYFNVVRYQENNRNMIHPDPAVIPETRAEAIKLLGKHGFTESDIDRVAVEASFNTLASLENLALKHELRREAILCEIERRRERRTRQPSPPASRQLEGESRALAKGTSDAS
jgi:hypothetical protein